MTTRPLNELTAVDTRPPILHARAPERGGALPGKTPPIIFLVSSEAAVLGALEADLRRRFGSDTRIVGADGPRGRAGATYGTGGWR